MKRIIPVILALFAGVLSYSQEISDSLYVPAAVDSTLQGRDIINVIQSADGNSTVYQSASVGVAFRQYVARNASKPMQGYRIRVYYDSDRTSRGVSESIARQIAGRYPGLKVYRTFDSPNFKVAVGDFRTKDEALALFKRLKSQYPAAFIIKENINYPLVDADLILQ